MTINVATKRIPLVELTDPVRHEWQRLANSIGANPSLYPDWIEVAAKSHGIAKSSFILLAYDTDELVAVYPLTLSRRSLAGVKYNSMELVSNLVAYHNETVSTLKPDIEIELLIQEAHYQNAHALHLAAIADSSAIGKYLKTSDRTPSFYVLSLTGDSSPYLPLTMSWDDLLASKAKKFRYKARQREKTLAESSTLYIKWYTNAEDSQDYLDIMRTIEEHSWKKNAGLAIFDRPIEKYYHHLMLPLLLSKGAVRGSVLFQCDTPVAYSLCCVWKGWAGQLKTSFDARHSELSPGAIIIDNAIQYAIEQGATEFDFLGDANSHKLAWTKKTRQHTSYFLYLKSSFRGNLIGRTKKLKSLLSR